MSRALRSALQPAFLSDPEFCSSIIRRFRSFSQKESFKIRVGFLSCSRPSWRPSRERVCQETRSSCIEDLASPSPTAAQGHCDSSLSLTRPDPRIRPGQRNPSGPSTSLLPHSYRGDRGHQLSCPHAAAPPGLPASASSPPPTTETLGDSLTPSSCCRHRPVAPQ